MDLWFPRNVSTFGAEVDGLFMIILWITGVIFVGTEVALVYFAFKYRHKPGRKARHIHGDNRLEIAWTAIPFVLVIYIALISMKPWLRQKDPNRFPPAALTVEVTAKQFEWNVKYPGPDGTLGTADDVTTRNKLNLPVNRVIHVSLLAEDVIHSFFLPELRVKQDAVPGMTTKVWFEAMEAGEYVLGCAELCGLGHYRMKGSVVVVDGVAFDAWQNSGGTGTLAASPASRPVVAASSVHTGH